MMWWYAIGAGVTVAGWIWSWQQGKRLARLEQRDMEREEAESSTVVRRPAQVIRFRSLRPVPWEKDAG